MRMSNHSTRRRISTPGHPGSDLTVHAPWEPRAPGHLAWSRQTSEHVPLALNRPSSSWPFSLAIVNPPAMVHPPAHHPPAMVNPPAVIDGARALHAVTLTGKTARRDETAAVRAYPVHRYCRGLT